MSHMKVEKNLFPIFPFLFIGARSQSSTHTSYESGHLIISKLTVHTKDNIVSYYPNGKVLFGGCLIKSEGAGKGYLGDANLHEWSNTVESLKRKYPDVEVVIPGHGNTGKMGLLDYNIKMVKE
ncbi:hypothetical protein HPE56_09610 [Maribacter sp. ANRC-HE7]|uniref:Metallo-beta-lactamase domain-containing protein n=1 Tax=Maribacter aquimaris TaxID=2737171 RepID=A0ABR7UZN2_9FLAO|nr:hypothetical protein [Maribacter aquimaris]